MKRGIGMTKDEQLNTEIHEALLRDKRVSARVIGVDVNNRIVTICGAPQSYRRILAAIEIVASFAECRGVINKLRVRRVPKMDDAEIANLVRTIFDVRPEIRNETIAVAVRDGEVTLTGTVSTHDEGILVEDIILGISGVRSVRNLLLCDVIDQVEDSRIGHDVETALERSPGLRDVKLRVAFDGETLVLTGSVPQPWQKELAESVVERFRPLSVRNNITTG